MKKAVCILLFLLLIFPPTVSYAENFSYKSGVYAVELKNDTLCIENDLIKRTWLWNGGSLITLQLDDKKNHIVWPTANKQPDLLLPGEKTTGSAATIKATVIPLSAQYVSHLQVTVEYELGELNIRKIIKLYASTPAIACDLYLRGKAAQTWIKPLSNAADLQNIERLTSSSEAGKVPSSESLLLSGNHWQIEAVEFLDITDRFNTLVRPVRALSYRDCIYRGNILFAENSEKAAGFFFLKEAPTSNVQLHYPNGDFLTNNGTFHLIGLGVDSVDINADEWTKAYGYVTGLFRSDEQEKLSALRAYQQNIRPFLADRDEMIMLNTWGDRGQDTRVNEAFCLNELKLAAKLGVTHFQIDDGWQAGRSANSAYGGSYKNIWDNPNYWTPDPERFPNGLAPIVQRGKELGIEICLWFNPSIQNDFADWEKDANALIALYQKYGIRTFKIDGTAIPNKISEIRLRNIYERVMEATDWQAVLNLDATAGRRGGYFFFNEYGNIFLENRYTDWTNYYPYWTLRNLWMLSRYLPAQMLQIEFLNKWRNQNNYANDRFGPANYSFDYLFAITLTAQPLAWMEAANLPEEAYALGETVSKYKSIRNDFHQGTILPVGEEPSGRSWTGFQSIKEESGYLLLFREDNTIESVSMPLYLAGNQTVEFTPVIGSGEKFAAKTDEAGNVRFSLPTANSFVLYQYNVR